MYVYKYEKCKFYQPFLSFQPKNFSIGKSKVCELTQFSGAFDSSDFDGNTILLECEDNEYVYIFGLGIFNFEADGKIINYITLMGNNMVPHAIIIGEKYTYFIAHLSIFIENDKIEKGSLLISLNPFAYHINKCGIDSFKKLERSLIHSCWPGH